MQKSFYLGFFFLLILSGCATPYNPFSVAKEEIYATVDVIGLVPFYSQIDADDLDVKLAAMEEEVTRKLEAAGFRVVPSGQYQKIYDEYKKSIGPMYDPDTGKLDEEKSKVVKEKTLEEYLNQHGEVDAFMYGSINVVKASWSANTASWHGASEPTSGKASLLALFALGQTYGTIPALSFAAYIERTDKTRLYSLYGGIQLAQWYQGGEFVDVPRNLLLSDTTKINAGIARSLYAFVTKGVVAARDIYKLPEQ